MTEQQLLRDFRRAKKALDQRGRGKKGAMWDALVLRYAKGINSAASSGDWEKVKALLAGMASTLANFAQRTGDLDAAVAFYRAQDALD